MDREDKAASKCTIPGDSHVPNGHVASVTSRTTAKRKKSLDVEANSDAKCASSDEWKTDKNDNMQTCDSLEHSTENCEIPHESTAVIEKVDTKPKMRAKMSMSPNKSTSVTPTTSTFTMPVKASARKSMNALVSHNERAKSVETSKVPDPVSTSATEESPASSENQAIVQNGKENTSPRMGEGLLQSSEKAMDINQEKAPSLNGDKSQDGNSINPKPSSEESEAKALPTTETGRTTPCKTVPKARKSCHSAASMKISPAKSVIGSSPLHAVTLQLKEIERTLGIKSETLSKIDAKTLDKLILDKANAKSKSPSVERESRSASREREVKTSACSTPVRASSVPKESTTLSSQDEISSKIELYKLFQKNFDKCSIPTATTNSNDSIINQNSDCKSDNEFNAAESIAQENFSSNEVNENTGIDGETVETGDVPKPEDSNMSEAKTGSGAGVRKKRRRRMGSYNLPRLHRKSEKKGVKLLGGRRFSGGDLDTASVSSVGSTQSGTQVAPHNNFDIDKLGSENLDKDQEKSETGGEEDTENESEWMDTNEAPTNDMPEENKKPLLEDSTEDTVSSAAESSDTSCRPPIRMTIKGNRVIRRRRRVATKWVHSKSKLKKEKMAKAVAREDNPSDSVQNCREEKAMAEGSVSGEVEADNGKTAASKSASSKSTLQEKSQEHSKLTLALQSPPVSTLGTLGTVSVPRGHSSSLELTKAALDAEEAQSKRTLRKRKAIDVGCRECEHQLFEIFNKKHSLKFGKYAKRRKPNPEDVTVERSATPDNASSAGTPHLSPIKPASPLPPGREHSPNPPVISPQKPIRPKRIESPNLVVATSVAPSGGGKVGKPVLYTQSILKMPGLLKQQALNAPESKTSQQSSSNSGSDHPPPVKYVNTPNGISYPVTPPKTPDTNAALVVGQHNNMAPDLVREQDFMPLCCCKISGASFMNVVSVMYCQALDSIDGKVVGCCQKVNNTQMVRPAVKIPFMAICEGHRKRLKDHQCCPGCGHFCTEGKFLQCKKDGSTGYHHFHRQCQVFKDNKYFCPHCGEESQQYEVSLKASEPRLTSFLIKPERKSHGPQAKMTFQGTSSRPRASTPDPDKTEPVVATLKLTGKEISSAPLPLGPSRTELENTLAILNGEKPKKLRTGPKNLYYAAKNNELEKLLFLLAEGCDPNAKFEEYDNQCALHAAAAKGSLMIVHVLLQAGASSHATDNSLRTPLMEATDNSHISVIKTLIKSGAIVESKGEDGMSCLHLAAKAGNLEVIKYLLYTERLDINVKDDGGWTPIIWASEHGHLHVVRFLLSAGADPNIKDNEENTGLHWAAFAGSVDIAELFLNAGCDLEAANEHGDRPLHISARQDHYECVVLFLARGADSEARNNENDAPISCCADQNSQVWMALRVNRQLKGFAAQRLCRPERLLHRDISMGREANPVPVVNDCDDENYPADFAYVIENVETSPMNINRSITSLQSCKCKDDCSSMFCVCSRNSVRCWYDKEGHLVKEFNQIEPPLIFECNKACRCWANCQNRVVQMGITCRLQVFRTQGRGWGVKTLLNIPQGTFVCEYIGEHISDAEADAREDDSYLFDLDNKDSDTFCIDARKYANVARFINHLCEPNLIPVKVFMEHQDLRFPRICFFSSRDIKAGEELGFDYGEKFWIIKWKQFTCECGSPKCKYNSTTIHQTITDYNRRQQEEEALEAD